ncbi:hypothetical protein PVAP13_8NG239504 [Panicum virgatum]|uniref:Uncharacterized protein n=1 Tax=Panicum virgatum TaxID=38727 RepID=A0A8T0P737_PANVG|nr:hypothetical protein PVAP13_8NG239504 [Panicum virgatum]
MDDNTDSEGVRSSNEAKRSKQTSREDEHTSTCDGGSLRAAVPMNLEGCSTKLTICEGEDGTESSNGDVLIFPDMIRYKAF